MKKSIFFLLAVMMTISFTSCYDDIYPNVNDRGVSIDNRLSPLDSISIYRSQIDKGNMLNNLVRFSNGRYYLDLTKDDAEILGISSELYNNALHNVEQMNNNK